MTILQRLAPPYWWEAVMNPNRRRWDQPPAGTDPLTTEDDHILMTEAGEAMVTEQGA